MVVPDVQRYGLWAWMFLKQIALKYCGVLKPRQGRVFILYKEPSWHPWRIVSPSVLNPCLLGPGRMSIILGVLSDRTGLEHSPQIWEAQLGLLSTGNKSWIHFALHPAINSAKGIFIKNIQNVEKLLAWKGCHTETGRYQRKYSLANEEVSLYYLIGLKANQPRLTHVDRSDSILAQRQKDRLAYF